jgi:O-antigen/teichoic acid export membrane protein
VFREALPFGTSGLMNPLLAVADKALLLYVLGEPQLGLYAVALTAASAMSSLSQAAAQVTFGMSARSNDATVFRRVGRVFRVTAWIWMLGGLVLAALMPILLPLIFGQAFEPAVWPAIVLIGAAALAGQAGVLEDAMRGQGRAFVGLEARVAGMTLFLAVGWWAARQWGIIGAAAAYVLGQSIVLAVMIMAARLHFREIGLWTLIPRIEDLRELVLRVLAIATWMRREDSCVCEGSATARSRAHLE